MYVLFLQLMVTRLAAWFSVLKEIRMKTSVCIHVCMYVLFLQRMVTRCAETRSWSIYWATLGPLGCFGLLKINIRERERVIWMIKISSNLASNVDPCPS
jgi:hypothetical protein